MVTNPEYEAMDKIMAARRKQAQDRNIYHKAVEIAKRLGTRTGKGHGANHNYKDHKIAIWWDDYGSNMKIDLVAGDQASLGPVFHTQLGDIKGYRPDVLDWEARVDELYEGLEPQMKSEDTKERERKRLEFFKDWGVWPDP